MIHVIVVDDEKRSRELLAHLLTNFVDDVTVLGTAGSAKEGKALIMQCRPNRVFLDIEMPDLDGFSLFLP